MAPNPQEPAAERQADRLSALLALHEVALDSMAHGLCVFDAALRVALFNRRYLEIFNLSPGVIRAGLPYRAMIDHSAERGNLTPDEIEPFWRERHAKLMRREPFAVQRRLPSGI